MKTAYPEIVVRAVALIVFLLFVIGVTAADDDTLARIANYRQWTKVSQDLDIREALSSIDLNKLDLSTVGG